jgi:hypothetical protein
MFSEKSTLHPSTSDRLKYLAGSPVLLGDPRAVIAGFSYEFQVIGHAGDIEYAKEIFRHFQVCG